MKHAQANLSICGDPGRLSANTQFGTQYIIVLLLLAILMPTPAHASVTCKGRFVNPMSMSSKKGPLICI